MYMFRERERDRDRQRERPCKHRCATRQEQPCLPSPKRVPRLVREPEERGLGLKVYNRPIKVYNIENIRIQIDRV